VVILTQLAIVNSSTPSSTPLGSATNWEPLRPRPRPTRPFAVHTLGSASVPFLWRPDTSVTTIASSSNV
jgi:hypothetical protein